VNVRGNLLICKIGSGKCKFILDPNNIKHISLLLFLKLRNVHVKSTILLT
jgi:hypothetical protein